MTSSTEAVGREDEILHALHELEKDSEVCPFCGSDNISSEPAETDTGTCWFDVSCYDCEEGWTEVYEFSFFEIKEVIDGEAKFYQSGGER
jgi:hypothetical protein